MAPNGKVVEADGIKEKSGAALDLMAIKRAIPDECFVKSPLKATVYMLFDYGMIAASFYSMWTLSHSPQWATMPAWQQWVATGVYWNIAGFFMWCIFVVGHDCGHGTFSDSELLNDIVGHITHGSIMVPYYPWRVSFLVLLFEEFASPNSPPTPSPHRTTAVSQ
jgi:omega-3 fatty acid desaturase (delta-15 desaturase)